MSKEKFLRDDEQFDDLFRTSLGEMRTEPSTGVWNKVSRKMLRSELLRFRFTNLPKVFWGIVPAIVIITGVGLYLGLSESATTPGQPVVTSIPSAITTSSPPANVNLPVANVESPVDKPTQHRAGPGSESYEAAPRVTATGNAEASGSVKPKESVAAASVPVNTQESVAAASVPVNAQESVSTESGAAISGNLNLLSDEPSYRESLPEITPLYALDDEPLLPATIISPVIRPVPNPFPQETIQEPTREPLSRWLDLGINITPDMVFYNQSSGSFKYNYTFDLGARYSIGRFYIQSGAGLTYSTDIGDYAISYLKNDSIGYYYTINSFSVEPGNPQDPQFEAKQVTVYDSVQYLYDYSTKNHYAYLQIPLSFGYRIINKPVWRLSVEAGLVYSYLVSVNEPSPTFTIPEGRILDIERRTPERNKNSLGLTAGINVEYQFARNFFLLIEPTFKYYMQAIEENSSRGDKQPYSIGLRAGIWYRLNIKNRTK